MKHVDSRAGSNEAALQAAVAALAARIAAIEDRLGLPPPTAGDAASATPSPQQASASAAAAAAPPVTATAGFQLQLPTVGISFLILAGAFLLRALTGSGTVGGTVGVSLGLAYVAVLLVVTDRAARRGQRPQAQLFGVSTVLVAYPFLWETSTKLALLPARGAVAATAALAAIGLVVSLRHRLRVLAWITLLAAAATSTGLFWVTPATELFLALMLLLGAATVWLGYRLGWTGPRWPVAAVVNFLIFLTVMMAAHPGRQAPGRPQPDPEGALLLALALPAVYLGSFAWRTLVARREAGLFEILQSLGCLAAGYVGAIHLLHVGERSTAALGWGTLAAAVAAYAVAFVLVRGRQGRGLNFFYFAWLGLLLMLIGSALVVPGDVLPLLWCGLALAAAVTGGVFDRWTLRLHCAAYLVGAAVTTGLPAAAFAAFAGHATPAWQHWSTVGVIVWLTTLGCYGLLVGSQRGRHDARWRRIPRFLTAALALTGAGIVVVTAVSLWLSGALAGADRPVTAAVRTAVLAGSALLLAALGRRAAVAELGWFTTPLLVLAALKVLAEDLRHGTPVSLFVGFACFGVALILAPRLRRRDAPVHPDTRPEGDHGRQTP
jgi:hypothetical protein